MTYFKYGKSARRNPYSSLNWQKSDYNLKLNEQSPKIVFKSSVVKTRPAKKIK